MPTGFIDELTHVKNCVNNWALARDAADSTAIEDAVRNLGAALATFQWRAEVNALERAALACEVRAARYDELATAPVKNGVGLRIVDRAHIHSLRREAEACAAIIRLLSPRG